MYVVCPSCHSLFRASSAHLAAAGGQVRCSTCQTVFDATETCYDDPAQAIAAVRRLRESAGEIENLVGEALSAVGPADGQPEAETDPTVGDADDEGVPDAVPPQPGAVAEDDLPEPVSAADTVDAGTLPRPAYRVDTDFFAHPGTAAAPAAPAAAADPHGVLLDDLPPPRSLSGRTWFGLAASLLLCALLIGQYAWAERYQLARNPQVRPLLDRFCGLLGCDLPLRRDPGQLVVLEREVRDHPEVAGALLVRAAFANQAPFTQTWPVFEVSFSDISGTPLAVRRFRPREYLPPGYDPRAGMQAGQQMQVLLEILDPGGNAVSFQLEFL